MAYRGADPTDVMGRRIGAYLLDGLIMGVITAVVILPVFFSMANTAPAGSLRCGSGRIETQADLDQREKLPICFEAGDEIHYLRADQVGSFQAVFGLVLLAQWVGFHVLLQGIAGGSPGKLALGLRVVKPDGQLAGPLRCLVRTGFLVFLDAQCCAIIGLLTAFRSRGHRRVGDMVADTLVIGRDDQRALALARSGAALPDRKTIAAASYAQQHKPREMTWEESAGQIIIPGSPGLPTSGHAPSAAPDESSWTPNPDAAAPATWEPPPMPTARRGAPPPLPFDRVVDPALAGAPGVDEALWDEARGAWLWYETQGGTWYRWNDAAGQWGPLDP
ncbi:MAG: RDD family protein [Actinobacteria bacterium]|nr:RDD family protein [Actinomycetota bacterium]